MEVAYAYQLEAMSGKRKSEEEDSVLENFRTEMRRNYLEDFKQMLSLGLCLSQKFGPMFEGNEEKKDSVFKKPKLESVN